MMKRLLVVALFVLGMARATPAQEQMASSPQENRNAAADFAQTSAASTPMIQLGNAQALHEASAGSAFEQEPLFLDGRSAPISFAAATDSFSAPPAGAAWGLADPSPAPRAPSLKDEAIAFRMDISLGIAIVRFRSTVYTATAVGINTSFGYFLTDHLGFEGVLTPAFAPTIYQNEHIKYLGYGAGPKYLFWARGDRRLEPWAHAIIGGAHLFPQTSLGGKNGFEVQVGGGADYALNPHVAVRIGADWLRTQLWGQSQNSGQATLGVVYRF